MNKVIIDKMILSAMDILEENTLGILEKDKKIQSKYYGYIAAFGPSLMQTGLIQCIAFYSKTQTKEDKDRKKIIQLMEETLERTGRIKKAEHEKNLFQHLKNQLKDAPFYTRKRFTSYIMEACTACKLAIRTFPKIDTKEG